MKKTMLACALAAGCMNPASGQNVTLFGDLDGGVGYTRQDGSKSDLSIDSGTSSNSLIGVRGTEDLRGGLKANFRLEGGIDVDDGTWTDDERFFERAAWIGLQGGFGEVRLGRQATFAYDWFSEVSPFGTDYKQAALATIFSYEAVAVRVDNAVFYFSPAFGSFEAGLGYSFSDDGPETPGQDNEVLTLGLRYSNGPVLAVASYELRRDADQDAPDRTGIRNLSIGGTYDFSRFKLHAGYGQLKHRDFSRTARTEKAWLVGASLPLGNGELLAGYQRAARRNVNELDIDADRDGIALAYEYSLSKRTALYVYGSRFRRVEIRADDSSRLADRTQFGLGARHSF